MNDDGIEMVGVTEYAEGFAVKLVSILGPRKGNGRLVVEALNEGGCNSTEVDLLELLAWIKKHRPDLLA